MEVDEVNITINQPNLIQTTALNFNLTTAIYLLFLRIGIFSTNNQILKEAYKSKNINEDTYTKIERIPLIPITDAKLLLSILPSTLLPLDLNLNIIPSIPNKVTRQSILDTLAKLALEPALTLEISRRFRPLGPHFWGRWLEMLGLSDEGEWKISTTGEALGERLAIEKVYIAMIKVLPVFENVFPFLSTLLRHPLLTNAPMPPPNSSHDILATPLLTLHSLLHTIPHLPGSALTSSTYRLPWSFPVAVEEIMKTHSHRGTRLLAWRILRKWYGLYANTGEELREKWVWKGEGIELGALTPLPSYPEEYREEYEKEFGPFEGKNHFEVDLVSGFEQELMGEASFIDGGIEVLVRSRSVDVWLLPVMEDIRNREERANLYNINPLPVEWLSEVESSALQALNGLGQITIEEVSKVAVYVAGFLLFREGLIPSLQQTSSQSTTTKSTKPSSKALKPQPEPFVTTTSTTKLLRSISLHLQKRLPTLISSPPSSGKSSTITHLWSQLHSTPSSSQQSTSSTNLPSFQSTLEAKKRGLVIINLADRSLDSKSLLGSLSSAPATKDTEAGTFAFVEGPLTRAVRQGRWVVLTSIDQASTEVLSVIKTLAERMFRASESEVGGAWGGGTGEEGGGVGVRVGGGEGRWVRAGRGFMLFATRSIEIYSEPNFFASQFFSEIWFERPNSKEIGEIVEGRYERLRLVGWGSRLISVWEDSRVVVAKESGTGTVRPVGVRDLMRWCRRVEGLLPRDVVIKSIESNPILQEEIFTEARDIFLGSLPLPPLSTSLSTARDRYSMVAKVLSEGLGLSEERAEWVLRRRVPSLDVPKRDEDDGIASTAQLSVKIGRVALPYRAFTRTGPPPRPFALTKPSLILLEKLAVCVRLSEPVLLSGETGTGKTASVAYIAELLGKSLTPLNLSNQTEAGDLVGGFRPIDEVEEARRTASELVNRFVGLFGQTFSLSRNAEYVAQVQKAFEKKRWPRLVGLWREASRMAADRIGTTEAPIIPSTTLPDAPRKRRKVEPARPSEDVPTQWKDFITSVGDFDIRHVQRAGKSKFVFSFVEGPLAKAIRNGDWVLLDEINLASAETLESISTLLQAPDSSLILTEQGDLEPIPRHPEFRLFACMNPATDVGKRDLPVGLRSKFTEMWVPPPDEDRDALVEIVRGYIGAVAVHDRPAILHVADFYSSVKALAISAQLADGSNQPPHFSMRTLARALTFGSEFTHVFGLRRALYEGFVMAFTMLLDTKSSELVKSLLTQYIVAPAKNSGSLFAQIPIKPSDISSIRFGPYWLETGPEELEEPQDYILTSSVQMKVLDLARAILTRKVPVLIQGPTSSGKTSVVEYLAKRTGHRFVRINNHEHTDIQEYIGTYVSDTNSGKLVFQEGVLVRALRRGDWIVLDELNLAPTDVLEALNRLLDDNRELVIPETGEIVRPHPHFMLFATQNPPGLYGGRKVLSRAFRNRFLEMHFGDVPKEELQEILTKRCQIAPSYAKKTVAVFLELQRRRQAGRVFEQKHAFATLRDLFRWGGRGSVGYQQLAEDGYMLLAERARRPDDKMVVKEVIEQEMNVKIDETTLYDFARLTEAGLQEPPTVSDLVWTSAMRRLYFLIAAGIHRNEPILLVGETGSGKTSVCQSLALALGRTLHIVGCHQNTETADLLGGQRPLRNRASLQATLREEASLLLTPAPSSNDDFEDVIILLETLEKTLESPSPEIRSLIDRMRGTTALFEWHDGPLVQAMHAGDLILLDEISLADDSVLERLNSVLEPSRTLVLAEKGGRDLDDIRVVASPEFQILATMNPGGDFGKKELSPALRNRFTEIWVPLVDDPEDLLHIIGSRWKEPSLEMYGPKILEFGQWFGEAVGASGRLGIGLRDILAWVDFLNASTVRDANSASLPLLIPSDAFCQGALMTVVDGLGALPTSSGLSKDALEKLKASCWKQLSTLVPLSLEPEASTLDINDSALSFSVGSFGVSKGSIPSASVEYTLQAPTTRLNAMRLLRALQLTKPVLLEGSPGVGKTSLVTAIAAATGHPLVRINLSDQTDLMDLLGSDLPVEGGKSGEFAWKDAPFLAAMQQGAWVLLDEMNLASQSILEGLNSCLDHRGTVYIPELDRTFTRHPDFRIFAAQNPLGQGGGRKGLPRSFLDRFSIVHMAELDSIDLNAIASSLYPDIDPVILQKMIIFNTTIHKRTMESRSFGMEGSPWEFNLRDVLRWLSLLRSSSGLDLRQREAIEYVGLLYVQRFRTLKDRTHVATIFQETFDQLIQPLQRPFSAIGPLATQIGHSALKRSDDSFVAHQSTSPSLLHRSLQPLEALMKCLEMGWLAILTGSKSGGKTTLVRQLAALEGRTLREFSMNAEVDTLELLGSFEQAERYRELDRIASDVLLLLQDCLREQVRTSNVLDLHSSISTIEQLRLDLGVGSVDFDLVAASATIYGSLEFVPATFGPQVSTLVSRLELAATSTAPSARFEWIDGPLVQAMKNGDWLLIEDANLCSPSVLDRLNSLFEPGGRLQLAERGPVDGEIQIIVPHSEFRLVMTLDPRHGELSRAMRNRGIEIALLDPISTEEDLRRLATFSRRMPLDIGTTMLSEVAILHSEILDSSPTPQSTNIFASDSFTEPTLSSFLTAASISSLNSDLDTLAKAHYLISSVSTAQYSLVIRFLRSLAILNNALVEPCARSLLGHALIQQIEEIKVKEATEREIPLELLRLQANDLSINPHLMTRGDLTSSLNSLLSTALDSLVALRLSRSSRPEIVRVVSAIPTRSLTVWEKSMLATMGRLRMEEADPAMLSLYPVSSALGNLVSRILSLPFAELQSERMRLTSSAKTVQLLATELEYVSQTTELDFSSIQHIASWIALALKDLPVSAAIIAMEAKSFLEPLKNSLTLSSGKAMTSIWKSSLPYQSPSAPVAEAYSRLMVRGATSQGEVWGKSVVYLFLDVAVSLGTPQSHLDLASESGSAQIVDSILLRIPELVTVDSIDPSLSLTVASNAASLIVAELATVAKVLGFVDQALVASTLVQVVQISGVVSLASIVPVHQLVSWPSNLSAALTKAKSSVEFATLLGWSEHLALGTVEVDRSLRPRPSDVVRPSLLRTVIALRSTDTSTLGNLNVLSESLRRAASLQVVTAAVDSSSRVAALASALFATITLVANSCNGDMPIESLSASNLNQELAGADRQLNSNFQESVDLYLTSALPALNSEESSIGAVGSGFVALARTLWHLYVPNIPLDPAIGLRAYSSYLERQLASLSNLCAVLESAEGILASNGTDGKIFSARAEISRLREELDRAGVVPVKREGDPALLLGLFRELRSFHEQVIGDGQLDSLLEALHQPWSTEIASRESNLQHSVETLLNRLSLAYGTLSDILGPIRLSLCFLKIGFSFLAYTCQATSLDSTSIHFATLLQHLANFPTAAHLQEIESVDLPLSIKVGETPLPPSRATLLQITALSSRIANNTILDRNTLHRLTQLYDRLHYLWTADRRHEEEAAREAESLYKFKVDIQQVASDEEQEAADFALMFPTFEEESMNDDPVIAKTNGKVAPIVPRLLRPSDQATLARLHVGIFGTPSKDFVTSCNIEFDEMRAAGVATLLPGLFDSLDESLDRQSTPFRIRSLVELSQAAAPPTDIESRQRDFYNEPDVKETSKVVPILQSLSVRLGGIIEHFPDQMVLHNLRERTETLLKLSAKSSIAQVLTSIERLLNHTEDWESYASREHSLVINRTSITNLIVEWRRLELTCWSRLLSTVQAHFGDPVSEWWFRFYETTIRGAPGVDSDAEVAPTQTPEEYYRDLVVLMDSFLGSSSLGQYSTRLELVLSFANLAETLGEDSPHFDPMPGAASLRMVSRILKNIYGFYNQFIPRVNAFINTERARIEKDVQNLIKLASWKDVNVYALQQSAIRSHHNLYKSVRKLRAVLQKPASDFFTVPEAEKSPVVILNSLATLAMSLPLVPALPSRLATPTDSAHIVNLEQTLSRFNSLITTAINPFVTLDRATAIDEFTIEIITTSKSLKAESKPGPEEGREERVKNLSIRKRRAWVQLLKELKRLGLSNTPTPNVVARVRDSSVVYGLPASTQLLTFSNLLLDGSSRQQLLKSDDYHFRLLSEVPALQDIPASHHEDISTREVQRAIGSIESCISLGFDNRIRLVNALHAQVKLQALSHRLKEASATNFSQPTLPAKELVQLMLSLVSQVVQAFKETRVELKNHRSAMQGSTFSTVEVEEPVNDAIALLSGDQAVLENILKTMAFGDVVISKPEEISALIDCRNHLISIISQVCSTPAPTSLRYLFQPLSEFLLSLNIPVISTLESTTDTSGELDSLKTSHTVLIDSVLVIVQELRKLSSKVVPAGTADELPDLAILQGAGVFKETLAIFRVPELLDQVNSFSTAAHQLLTSNNSSFAVNTLLSRITPFLRLFTDLFNQHLLAFFEWHKATLKLAFVLVAIVKELSAEGFCKPLEDDGKGADDGANGKTTDGTGMADGQGATNVSKDIEEESQIEGLENDVDKEKEEKPEEKEGDDDAVEMTADFEGEMEDRGDGDKDDEDEDDNSDKESEVDPEEQIADVDPLDPSSVDEKFWGDENSKEQDPSNEEINQETTKPAGESEMTAKDDKAPEPKPKPKQDEVTEGAAPDDQKDQPGPDADAELDGAGDEEEGGDEGEDEEELDAPPQADDGERLDDRMPEAGNLDLPDDMQLDGEDMKDENDLDLGDDMGEMDDPEEGENDNNPDQLEEEGDSKENDMDADEALPVPETNVPESETLPDDVAPLDQSLGGMEQGENGGEGAENSSSVKPPPTSAESAADQPGAQADAEPTPVDESKPKDPSLPEGNEDQMDEDTDPSPTAPTESGDGQSKQRSSNSDPTSDPSRPRPKQPTPAEPQRSLGDALQSWRRRLEAISDLADTEPEKADVEASATAQDDEVEFVPEGDEKEEDGQALGPASEEQVRGLENLRLGEDDTQTITQEEEMEVDDSAAILPLQPTTVDLDAGEFAESEAKAIPANEVRQDQSRAEVDTLEQDDEVIMRDEDEELPSTTLAGDIDLEMDQEVEQAMLQWRSGDDDSLTSDGVWRLYESLTRDLSYALTEQLRLILEPTLATRLKGDYRSGKRLNMKKIIPYIASEFTKDKIWLRRTRPSQREYQILIAIDDSKSMADSHSVHLAFQSLALISRSLARLEVGGISICKFGDTMDVLHPFEAGPVSDEAGASLLGKFTFAQRTTDVRLLVERSIEHLTLAKERTGASKSSMAAGDLWQLVCIISDGLMQDHEKLRALLRKASEKKIMFVFVIIDSLHRKAPDPSDPTVPVDTDINQNSILAMQSVSYTQGVTGAMELKMTRYIDSLPFEYFVVLRNTEALPEVLSSTLRQFFESVSAE